MVTLEDREILAAMFIIFMVTSMWFPGIGFDENIATIRNVSSLLFGILGGFFIAFLLNRFSSLRNLVTMESTKLMLFFNLAKGFGDDFAKDVADTLDKYLVIRFDHDNYFFFSYKARDALFSLYDQIRKLPKVETQNMTTMHRDIVRTLDEIVVMRREIIVTGSITVSALQWSSIILLGFILISSLYYLKNLTIYSSLLTGLLSFGIFLFLYVIKDLSRLKLGGDMLKYETVERVFEAIGKKRYYPLSRVREGPFKKHIGEIRLGIGKNGDYSSEIIETTTKDAKKYLKKT